MNCPGCNNPIGKGPFPVVGVLKAFAIDKDSVEKEARLDLRVVSEFLPLAMVTCPSCHWVFFLPVDKAQEHSLQLEYSPYSG